MTAYGCYVALRVIIMILVLVATVLALVGTVPIPFYTNTVSNLDQGGSMVVTLWTLTVSKPTVKLSDGSTFQVNNVNTTVRVNYAACKSFKATFRALEAFGIGGTVIGFFAFLFACLLLCCRLKIKLPLFIFVLLAFICELLLAVIGGVAYTKGFCNKPEADKTYTCSAPDWSKNSNQTPVLFKQLGYKIGVGYVLHIISAVVFLVSLILVPFSQELWCGKA